MVMSEVSSAKIFGFMIMQYQLDLRIYENPFNLSNLVSTQRTFGISYYKVESLTRVFFLLCQAS